MKNDTIQAIRADVLAQLKKVTQANSPNMFERIQTKSGYAQMEAEILRRMLRFKMPASAVIPQIETEYQE